MKKNKKNYIFIDESGKPEIYSAKRVNLVEQGSATRFLVLVAIRCDDQLILQQKITDFKAELLRNKELMNIFSSAYALDNFHAKTDYPEIREEFYNFINSLDIKIDIIVVEKLKCHDTLKNNPGKMYGVMSGQLLKNICHQTKNTEIIFSRKDSKLKLKQELEYEVERIRIEYLLEHPKLESSLDINYQHNPHYTHGGLQIADYVAYAIFQAYERDNRYWYEIIKKKIGKVQDICNKKYFTRSNPL
ncbi:DUF3800 domain-containing protein [Patescibacteria group bacterium]|nr:DUF3800 domain-containing protein [Patescibacteria group bacterium]